MTTNEEENVKVVVRIRPLQLNEKKDGDISCANSIQNGKEVQIKVGPLEAQIYKCNRCFPTETSQSEFFYESGITDLIDSALKGYRTCAFAFGQTGAGKTFTMIGSSKNLSSIDKQSGMIGRSLEYLFTKLKEMKVTNYKIRLSCLEIYHEHVYDLLADEKERSSLSVREHTSEGFFLEGCKMIECDKFETASTTIHSAILRNRQVGTHDLNSRSSRSHCITDIFIDIPSNITEQSNLLIDNSHSNKVANSDNKIEIINDTNNDNTNNTEREDRTHATKGRISLIDLAGSERLKSTNSVGKILNEAGFINRSLYVLGFFFLQIKLK
jgi:hypothetical protein